MRPNNIQILSKVYIDTLQLPLLCKLGLSSMYRIEDIFRGKKFSPKLALVYCMNISLDLFSLQHGEKIHRLKLSPMEATGKSGEIYPGKNTSTVKNLLISRDSNAENTQTRVVYYSYCRNNRQDASYT